MPKRSDDVDLDLVEQCRAGDRTAFRTLVAFWSEPAMRVASTLVRDPAGARAVLPQAFATCWARLPSMHSETPFRPQLLGIVAREASARVTAAGGRNRLADCLERLGPRRCSAVALAAAGLRGHELAMGLGTNSLAARAEVRAAMSALTRCMRNDARFALSNASVPAVDRRTIERLTDAVPDHWLLETRRITTRPPHDAWNVLTDPTVLPAWVSAEGVHVRGGETLHPGAHIAARGRIAEQRRSRDESVITIAEQPRLLAWTTRSYLLPYEGAIEFRWTISIEETPDGCELKHRLRGVAFPSGVWGPAFRRAYARVEGSMQSSMHRGMERLASLVEASAR